MTTIRILTLLAASFAASAATLDFETAPQSELTGNTLKLELFAMYTGFDAQPPVGAYDLLLNFDENLLSLSSVEFSTMLGDSATDDVRTTIESSVGSLRMTAQSRLFGTDLSVFQGPVFPLVALEFSSALTPGDLNPGQSLEENFNFSFALQTSRGEECPEPATYALLGAGLLAMAVARRCRLPSVSPDCGHGS